jgi:short-subunit dehydrogenase
MSNWALVTGASDRIGKSIALKLAELGYDIIIHYNSSKKKAFDLQKQIQKLGVRCINIKCDFVKIKNIIKFCNEISQFQIKILINNASVFFEIDGKSEFNRTLDIFNINFFAPFLLIKKISETNSMFKVINILDTKISKNSISND